MLGDIGGMPPALDLRKERALIDLLVAAAAETLLASAHDCGDGGLAVALAECAIGQGHGFAVSLPTDLPSHVTLFSESASRAVVAVAPVEEDLFRALAAAHHVPAARIGEGRTPSADRRCDRRACDGAHRGLGDRDPAVAGRGRVTVRAVTFDFWQTLVSERRGDMRAMQVDRWIDTLAAAGTAEDARTARRRLRRELGDLRGTLA